MASRREKLNRLKIASPCEESWDLMAGDGARRHCARCDREVLDFSVMTPHEIERNIAAAGGRLCARITRSDEGQVVTLPPPTLPIAWNERRASPMAAAVMSAFLGLGASAGRADSTRDATVATAVEAVVEPDVPAEPAATFSDEMSVTATAPNLTTSVTAGAIVVTEEPLRIEYEESPLVVVAIAGGTSVPDPEEPSEVLTELRVTRVLKGRWSRRTLQIQHWDSEEETDFAPGTRILALLKPGDPRPGRSEIFVSSDYAYGVKALPEPALSAYIERLVDLDRIERKEGVHPADLAEWLVATAEDPLTRREATAELGRAIDQLSESANRRGRPIELEADELQAEHADRLSRGEPIPEAEQAKFVGAFLTGSQRARLTRAFVSAAGLGPGDLELYGIVSTWARDDATEGLIHRFQTAQAPDDDVAFEIMQRLADELKNPRLQALIERTTAEIDALFERAGSADDLEGLEAEVASLQADLRLKFLSELSQGS